MMRKFIILPLALFLAACVIAPPQPGCEEITTLRSQISKVVSPEQFRAWIVQAYQVSPESIKEDIPTGGQDHLIRWKQDGVWYTAEIEQGVLVDITRTAGRIAADHVIACLGLPNQYKAEYGWHFVGNELGLSLLFSDAGVLAEGAEFLRSRPKQPPAIDGVFPISTFIFTRPGSAEEVLRQVYGSWGADIYEKRLKEYKPWPGRWEDIVIDIDPNLQEW